MCILSRLVDCRDFKSSTFWEEFDRAVESALTTSTNTIEGANSTVDLVFPLLQEFLSSVEVLTALQEMRMAYSKICA